MTTVMLSAGGSHLYPGATGAIVGEPPRPGAAPESCVIEFADGSAAFGRIVFAAGGAQLEVGAYRTAQGTTVSPRRWALAISVATDGRRAFRATRRLGRED